MRHKCLVGLLLGAVCSVEWRGLLESTARSFVGNTGRGRRRSVARYQAPGKASTPDPRALLELPPGTTDESEVRSAFRRLAKLYHPDVPETGDVDKFQALQEAASSLLEGGEVPQFDVAEAFKGRKTSFSPRRQSTWSPPLDAGDAPSIRPEDARSFGAANGPAVEGRVNIDEVMTRKLPNLIKVVDLPKEPRSASPDTLRKVQDIISRNYAVGVDKVPANYPLEALMPMEGVGNIGAKPIADTLLELEEEFGIELITVMVRTWVRSKIPADVRTVGDLANLLEAGAGSGAASSAGAQPAAATPSPQPAAAPAPSPQAAAAAAWSAPAPSAQPAAAAAWAAPAPQVAPPAQAQPVLPAPWEQHWSDEYQRPYYWNPATQESLWEPPSA